MHATMKAKGYYVASCLIRQFELPRIALRSVVLIGFLLLSMSLFLTMIFDVRSLSILNLKTLLKDVKTMQPVNLKTLVEEVNSMLPAEDLLRPFQEVEGQALHSQKRFNLQNSMDSDNKGIKIDSKFQGRQEENDDDRHYSQRSGFHNSMESNKTWTEKDVESRTKSTMEPNSNSTSSSETSKAKERTEQGSRMACDVSEPRTDVCELYGGVMVHSNASSIFLVTDSKMEQNTTWKIRPYARKWEPPTMSFVKEFTLRSLVEAPPSSSSTPKCDLNHSIPAIIFSTGGFQGNFFHELNDVLIPLFLTSHQYHGEVRFLVADFKSWWVEKYQPILTKLSRYDVINLDMETKVHCFKEVVVGLRSHKELGIDPRKSPKGYSMTEFRRFLRHCYSLNRESASAMYDGSRKKPEPKLVIISRKKSRAILNQHKVVKMARGLGLKVVVAGAAMTKNLTHFSRVVNSGDMMLGVHGAGLSNMVFLPTKAMVIQIIPWGGLKWACRFAFGDPAMDMGLRYMEYEVGKQESSLTDQYPSNHQVFTDPLSIHKQGFHAIWSMFLDKQNVRIDVRRFRSVLLEAIQRLQEIGR